jgi:hypothetical protein
VIEAARHEVAVVHEPRLDRVSEPRRASCPGRYRQSLTTSNIVLITSQGSRSALCALKLSSSRWSGCAIAINRRARSAMDCPRSSATPYSVTTLSTVFLIVVTALPGVSWVRMRPRPLPVVDLRTMNPWPPSDHIAPRAKSACPPLEE